MKLKNLQNLFLESLLQKNPPPEVSSKMLSLISSQKGIDNEKRLAVYQKSYRKRIIHLLQGDYNIFSHMMGYEKSWKIFSDYLDKNPSHEFSLVEIGRAFPYYVSQKKHEYPKFIPDLVEFEWLLHASFYREYDRFQETVEFPCTLLNGKSKTKLQVQLHPSVQVYWSHWPLDEIYSKKKNQDVLPSDTGLLIWSMGGEVKFEKIEKFFFGLVEGLQKGGEIHNIVNQAASSMDTAAGAGANTTSAQKEIPSMLEKAMSHLASKKLLTEKEKKEV